MPCHPSYGQSNSKIGNLQERISDVRVQVNAARDDTPRVWCQGPREDTGLVTDRFSPAAPNHPCSRQQLRLWFCWRITGMQTCLPVTERMAVAWVHTPTGSPSDFNSNKEAKGAVASWMVWALTLVGSSVQNGHLISCLECFLSLELQSQNVPVS